MSNIYAVSDASQMLNVNEETIRRWIREGKLSAKRAVGRGGNTIRLVDVVNFANKPPRAYLLPLEVWLKENGIAYERIEDPKTATIDRSKTIAAVAAGSGAALASTLATAPLVGLAAAGIVYSATKRKLYQTYTIQLATTGDDSCAIIPEGTACQETMQNANLLDSIATPTNQTKPEQSVSDVCAGTASCEMREVTNPSGILEEITRAKQMLDEGIITQDEFAEIKSRLIAKL